MHKKSLVSEIDNLVKRNNQLFNEKEELTNQLKLLTESNKTLEEKISLLEDLLVEKNNEIDHLKNTSRTSDDKSVEECDIVLNETENKEIDLNVSDNETTSLSHDSLDDIDFTDGVKIASTVIGEVVLKCSEICTFFAEQGGSNAKDLINLALGRTEVFKAEALCIIEENNDDTVVSDKLNDGKNATFEYFELLKKQV